MPIKPQIMQVTQDRYEIIMGRYKKYQESLSDPNSDPVTVFDPLPKKLVDELELIREVSRELQHKKDEDMKKAAQAALKAEEDAKKAAEEEKLKAEQKEEEKSE